MESKHAVDAPKINKQCRMIPDEVVTFKHDMPIELFTKDAPTFTKTNKFDPSLVDGKDTWHQVICHHNKRFTKISILKAFHKRGINLAPVGYKKGELEDKFLIWWSDSIFTKLFSSNLCLPMDNKEQLEVTIRLNVASRKEGHITTLSAIERALNAEFLKCKIVPDVGRVLRLDKFDEHPEFLEIGLKIRHRKNLDVLLRLLASNPDRLKTLQGIKMSHNGIATLVPFEKLRKSELCLLDLSFNDLATLESLKRLQGISIKNLFIEGNPFCKDNSSNEICQLIIEILPNIIQLNGVNIDYENPDQKPIPTVTVEGNTEIVEPIFEGVEVWEDIDSDVCEELKNSKMWHMITIPHNGAYTKSQILDKFFITVDENLPPIYPSYYKIGTTEDSFLVNSCSQQMLYLVRKEKRNLQMPKETLKMKIHLFVSPLTTDKNYPTDDIIHAAASRFNVMDKSLDLSDFKSCGFFRHFETSLSCWKVLQNVLTNCGRKYLNGIVSLDLSNNGISTSKGLDALRWMQKLKVLNLGRNRFRTMNCLKDIPKLEITEIVLDGNPLCELYNFPDHYFRDVKTVFPMLVKLDGLVLSGPMNFLPQQNYLCSMSAHDFVEQFVSTYFRAFETQDRKSVISWYHPKAIFSMSSELKASTASWYKKQLVMFQAHSRNILDHVGHSSSLFVGREAIADVFQKLPYSEHDWFSMKTDLTKFTPNLVVLTVYGIFRYEAEKFDDCDINFSFSRTFIFVAEKQSSSGCFEFPVSYQISNEVFHIAFATPMQSRAAFQSKPRERSISPEVAHQRDDKDACLILMQNITNLKMQWCKKLLKMGKWQFEDSLQAFVDMAEHNKIPANAFQKENKTK